MKRFIKSLIVSLPFIIYLSYAAYSAARGSGASTRDIGPTNDTLYLPAAEEDRGWGVSSTDSINNNFIIISSAIYDLETTPGNTNYIQLRTTLQPGSTFFVSSATIQNLFISSTTGGYAGVIPANLLAPNSTSYIQLTSSLQSNATFYVSTGTAVDFNTTNITVLSNFTSSGTSNIGDASGDKFNIFTDSITLISPTTFYAPTGSLFRYQESGATSKCFTLIDPILLRSSSVTNVIPAFETFNISTYVSVGAGITQGIPKKASIKVQCLVTSDATPTANVALYIRSGDSVTGAGSSNTACIAYETVSTQNISDYNVMPVDLSVAGAFEFSCQPADPMTSATCRLDLVEVCY